jgi:hypothetical protein
MDERRNVDIAQNIKTHYVVGIEYTVTVITPGSLSERPAPIKPLVTGISVRNHDPNAGSYFMLFKPSAVGFHYELYLVSF